MIVERECDWLPARAGPVGRHLVAADRAEPGKERRFAAPRGNLPHGANERRLDDVLGGVFVAKPPNREAEQARKERIEEFIERVFVAGSHALNELGVIHIVDPETSSPDPRLPRHAYERGQLGTILRGESARADDTPEAHHRAKRDGGCLSFATCAAGATSRLALMSKTLR